MAPCLSAGPFASHTLWSTRKRLCPGKSGLASQLQVGSADLRIERGKEGGCRDGSPPLRFHWGSLLCMVGAEGQEDWLGMFE